MAVFRQIAVAEANQQLAAVYEAHVPEQVSDIISSIELMRLDQVNLYPWIASGIPAILGIQVLGFLVLVIASLNYTNLATAQAMRRTRLDRTGDRS